MMSHRYLGRTGMKVSELCLGATMTFYDEAEPGDHRRILDRFADAGGNFLDTADVYGLGRSEELLGAWLEGRRRDDFVVATKVGFATTADTPGAPASRQRPNEEGLSRKHVLAAVEASLRRLRTDHIDLYTVHGWDPATPFEQMILTFDALVRSGKVRYVGVSNFCGWQLQKTVDLGRELRAEPVVMLQALYNLLDRSAEWELIPVCRIEGLALTAWGPLRSGWLGGRIRRGMAAPPPDSKVLHAGPGEWERYANERTWRVIDALEAVAREVGCAPAPVALRWLLQKPGVTAPVIGARTPAQLEECLRATAIALTEDQMARLDRAGDVDPPYPYDILRRTMLHR